MRKDTNCQPITYVVEHNTENPSSASTSQTRSRRPDLSTFFATLSQITPNPGETRTRQHAVPVPADVSAAFRTLAEAFDIMRREHEIGGRGEGEGQGQGRGEALIDQMIEALLREAETPPREVEGVSEEFCDGKYSTYSTDTSSLTQEKNTSLTLTLILQPSTASPPNPSNPTKPARSATTPSSTTPTRSSSAYRATRRICSTSSACGPGCASAARVRSTASISASSSARRSLRGGGCWRRGGIIISKMKPKRRKKRSGMGCMHDYHACDVIWTGMN